MLTVFTILTVFFMDFADVADFAVEEEPILPRDRNSTFRNLKFG